MIYYGCSNCLPHTTMDHEMYFPRACLRCDCKAMVNGEQIELKKIKSDNATKSKEPG